MSAIKFVILTVIIVAAYALGYLDGRIKEIKKMIDFIESIRNEESSSRKDA